jgi:hypothetical protein
MRMTKCVALFCLTLLIVLEVVRRRDDMQPETHHEINSPSPQEGIYGGYAGS